LVDWVCDALSLLCKTIKANDMPQGGMHLIFLYHIEFKNILLPSRFILIINTDPEAYIFYPAHRLEYSISVKITLMAWVYG
jgi:hypothetical protein